MKLQTERLCSSLSFPVLIIRVVGIPDKAYSRDIRERLLEQLEPLGSECVLQQRNSRRISTRSAQARDKAQLLRVSAADEYERNLLINLLRDWSDVSSDGEDHVRMKGHELGCQIWKSIQPTFRVSVFDCNVSAFNIAQLT